MLSFARGLIFLDQPSQVYFPKEDDFKNGTGDIGKVEDMYKSIIKFIEDANKYLTKSNFTYNNS